MQHVVCMNMSVGVCLRVLSVAVPEFVRKQMVAINEVDEGVYISGEK